MAVRITHRRMSAGGTRHEHIVSVKWLNEAAHQSGVSGVYPEMVDWIDKDGKAYVFDGRYRAEVGTVHVSGRTPYIRTHRDGAWTDNLLSLPAF